MYKEYPMNRISKKISDEQKLSSKCEIEFAGY